MDRREFLALASKSAGLAAASGMAGQVPPPSKPDYTLRIAPLDLEIAPGHIVKTTAYNGSVPGPLLRMTEGRKTTVEVVNETNSPELVHWHGLFVPSEVDGAAEEGTPMVPPQGSRSYTFMARPAGTRWYHTHVSAGRNLKRSTYTGQFGILYVEPKEDPGQYDAEVFLTLHGWDPYLGSMGEDEGVLEVIYRSYSVNGRALGHADPLRVKPGQRVLFRILNASATMAHRIALSGHKFTVLALDGNRVPLPQAVAQLDLGPAERIDALVTMDQPGVWVLGDVDDAVRTAGLGVVVEYANHSSPPRWEAPKAAKWNYTIFGRTGGPPASDVEPVSLVFRRNFAGNRWVDHWTINGKSFPKADPIQVRAGHRYRLRFDNQSDEAHPVHLHRHSFELKSHAGKTTAGVLKDVVVVPPRSLVEAEFLADNPGPALFHCHQQLHMDYGFMTMVEYAR